MGAQSRDRRQGVHDIADSPKFDDQDSHATS
jgi:hypothetical protein